MEQIQSFLSGPIGLLTFNLLIAIIILIVGYVVARIVASIVRRLLKRTSLDNRIADALQGPAEVDGRRPCRGSAATMPRNESTLRPETPAERSRRRSGSGR